MRPPTLRKHFQRHCVGAGELREYAHGRDVLYAYELIDIVVYAKAVPKRSNDQIFAALLDTEVTACEQSEHEALALSEKDLLARMREATRA